MPRKVCFLTWMAAREAILPAENMRKKNITYVVGDVCVNVRTKKLIIFWCIVGWCRICASVEGDLELVLYKVGDAIHC